MINPKHADALFYTGQILALDLDHSKALHYFTRAKDCGLKSAELYENIALSQFHLKLFPDAEGNFETAIKIESQDGFHAAPELVYYLGECQRLEHKFDLAISNFNTVTKYKNNNNTEVR